jgi:hypothetical protein
MWALPEQSSSFFAPMLLNAGLTAVAPFQLAVASWQISPPDLITLQRSFATQQPMARHQFQPKPKRQWDFDDENQDIEYQPNDPATPHRKDFLQSFGQKKKTPTASTKRVVVSDDDLDAFLNGEIDADALLRK